MSSDKRKKQRRDSYYRNKKQEKYLKEVSNEEAYKMGLYSSFPMETHSLEALQNDLKRQKKYNRPSYLKKLVEWAKTPYGEAYYKRKLGRD